MIPFEFLEVITEILYFKKINEVKSISMIGIHFSYNYFSYFLFFFAL